jgi:NTE family protein
MTKGSIAPPRTRLNAVRRLAWATAAGLLFAHQLAMAADPPAEAQRRPRIGLVLGGGGAKGAAHIGVIKVLEEMRVPVDCIAGTSMGALVGAGYATGLSASELEALITSVDWKNILRSAPRQDVPFHRKSLDHVFTIGLEVGVQDGALVAPSGVVPSHQIEALLRRVAAGAGDAKTFDDLPLPFRAVATDLETGGMAVFSKGDLAASMRASMAVPGAFAPVEIDGHLYVDGMLVRNLPVDVARQTCADVVIAVPVANPAVSRDRLNRLTSVAGQALNIAIEANEKVQLATLAPGDLAIPVVLKDITSFDFASTPEAVKIGEAAARQAMSALARYSVGELEYAQWRSGMQLHMAASAMKIDEIRITGTKTTDPEVMRNIVRTQPGEAFDQKNIDGDTTRLVAHGDLTSASYRISEEDGRHVLTYDVVEKPWGPNYLLFNLNFNTDMRGDTAWGVRLDYQKRWLNSLGGEFRTSLQVGKPRGLWAEFYQPMESSRTYFVAPSVFTTQSIAYLYQGDQKVAELDSTRHGLNLEVGRTLGTSGEVRLGVVTGRTESKTVVGTPGLAGPAKSKLGAGTLHIQYDTLDQRLFPSSGTLARADVMASSTTLGADSGYQVGSASLTQVVTVGANVWTGTLQGGTSNGDEVPYHDQFKEGGLFRFSGYHLNELVGKEFAFASVQYRRRLTYLVETFGTAAWGGFSLETGNVFQRIDGTGARGALWGGSLFLGVDSKLGPVYVGYGRSQNGHSAWYLYVGSALEAFR